MESLIFENFEDCLNSLNRNVEFQNQRIYYSDINELYKIIA